MLSNKLGKMIFMKIGVLIASTLSAILIVYGFIKHQSGVDMDKPEDLKQLHSIHDLFSF